MQNIIKHQQEFFCGKPEKCKTSDELLKGIENVQLEYVNQNKTSTIQYVNRSNLIIINENNYVRNFLGNNFKEIFSDKEGQYFYYYKIDSNVNDIWKNPPFKNIYTESEDFKYSVNKWFFDEFELDHKTYKNIISSYEQVNKIMKINTPYIFEFTDTFELNKEYISIKTEKKIINFDKIKDIAERSEKYGGGSNPVNPYKTNEDFYEITNKKIYLSKHDHLFNQVSISLDHKHIWAIDSMLNVIYQNAITGIITIVFNGYKYVNVSGNGNYLFLIDTNNDLYYYKIDKNKLIYNNYLEFLNKKDNFNKNISKYKCEIDNVIYPTYDYSKLSRSNQDLIRNNNSATQIDKLSCYQNCNIITNDGITYKKCIKNGENILFNKIKENEERINENLNSTIQQNKNAELAKKQKEAIEKKIKEDNEKKTIDAYKRILNKKYFFEKSDHCNNCIIKSSGTEYMLSRSYDNPEDCFDRAAVLGYNYSTHNPTNKKCYVSNNELFEKDDSLYSGLKTVKIKKLIPDLNNYNLNNMSGGCKEGIFNSSPLNVYEKRNTTYISKNPSFKTINSPESHKYNLLKIFPLISMAGYNTELTEPVEIARFLTFSHNDVVGFTDKYAIYKYQKLKEPLKDGIVYKRGKVIQRPKPFTSWQEWKRKEEERVKNNKLTISTSYYDTVYKREKKSIMNVREKGMKVEL